MSPTLHGCCHGRTTTIRNAALLTALLLLVAGIFLSAQGQARVRPSEAGWPDPLPPVIQTISPTRPSDMSGGGPVDGNCQSTIVFQARIIDNCCIQTDSVIVDVTETTGNAVLTDLAVNLTHIVHPAEAPEGEEVRVEGSVTASLTACSASVQVTINASDCSGNAAAPTVWTQAIGDATPPSITCPPDVQQSSDVFDPCEALVNPGSASATDNCDPNPMITATRNDGRALSDAYPCGATILTWTAADSCGNTSSCQQRIEVLPISAEDWFGSITVRKDVKPSDDSVWVMTLDGADPQTLAHGGSCTYVALAPGTYTVTEAGPAGYDPLVTVGGGGGSASSSIVVDLAPGEHKTVSFVNTRFIPGDTASSGCYNNNPIPDAGPDRLGVVGERIVLDGSASHDPDEDLPENFPGAADAFPMYRYQPRETLRFHWMFSIHHYEHGRAVLDIPRGSRTLQTIQQFDTEFPSFVPDLPGRYVLVLTVTDDYGASLMDEVTVTVGEPNTAETMRFSSGWHLVSMPLLPASTSLDTVGAGGGAGEPRIFGYTGGYALSDELRTGVGYWMYVRDPLDLRVSGLSLSDAFTLHLSTSGWHLIGPPFAARWEDTLVEHAGFTWHTAEAARRGVVEDFAIGTAPDGSYTQVELLLPWNGYWVYSHVGDVRLHLVEASEPAPVLFWTAPPLDFAPPGIPHLAAVNAYVAVSPNPSRFEPIAFRVDGVVVVDAIRVTVFDPAGHLVWQASAPEQELVWDGVRSDGRDAARGAYIYLIEILSDEEWLVAAKNVLVLSPRGE